LTTSLVGTWKLLSREDMTLNGERRTEPILGCDPLAFLMYDAVGHFAAQFMKRDRTSVVQAASTSNNSGAINGYDAYFGRYTVSNENTVTQELIGALSPADVGKVVTRTFLVEGNELIISLHATASDGQPVTRTLRWERVA
jgi:Lipocalin-like domain